MPTSSRKTYVNRFSSQLYKKPSSLHASTSFTPQTLKTICFHFAFHSLKLGMENENYPRTQIVLCRSSSMALKKTPHKKAKNTNADEKKNTNFSSSPPLVKVEHWYRLYGSLEFKRAEFSRTQTDGWIQKFYEINHVQGKCDC